MPHNSYQTKDQWQALGQRFARALLALSLIAGLLLPAQAASAAPDEPIATPDDEIVYIDGAGFIRVIDPNVAPGTQAVQWVSPEGGWYDFATGDFNNDGDMEIVAIGTGANKLTIYDPVVQDSSVTPSGIFNLIPWAELYSQAIPGSSATLVDAGNLDGNVAGDEIIFGFNVNEPNNVNYRLHVLKSPDGGRNWLIHVNKGFGAAWQTVDVGNINNIGSEDVVLTRQAGSLVEWREIDNDFNILGRRDDVELFNPRDAVIGQIYPGGPGEIAIGRSFAGTTEADVLLMYQFLNNSWTIAQGDSFKFFPHPTDLFTADVNGNGDDELFWLRGVASNASFARIFMINRGGDNLPGFQSPLDGDGGYKVGAGGDVDADGLDEVIIMRNNRIRNFYAVETGNSDLFTDYSNITTNNRSLAVANLDGTGFVPGARIVVTPDAVTASATAGLPANNLVIQIRVDNIGSGGNIPFSVRKESGASWFTLTFDNISQGNSIGSIYLRNFDASRLTPGTYTERLVVTSSNPSVVNTPLFIPVTFTVTPASFGLGKNTIALIQPRQQSGTVTQNVEVIGLPGLTYSAALLSKPSYDAAVTALGGQPHFGMINAEGEVVLSDGFGNEVKTRPLATPSATAPRAEAARVWPSDIAGITVSSVGETVPDTISITMDPDQMQDPFEAGVLIVLADDRAGEPPSDLARATVVAYAEAFQHYVPRIFR